MCPYDSNILFLPVAREFGVDRGEEFRVTAGIGAGEETVVQGGGVVEVTQRGRGGRSAADHVRLPQPKAASRRAAATSAG